MEQPKIYTPRQYEQLLHSMQPVYGLTKGLTSQAVAKAVRQALEKLLPVQDDLPEAIRKQYQLMDYSSAAAAIHFPENTQQYQQARRRLVFDEFFLFALEIQRLKNKTGTQENRYPMKPAADTRRIIDGLPYRLDRKSVGRERVLAGV